MRVLITGIDGFVGSHLAEYLVGLPGVEVHGSIIEASPGPNLSHVAQQIHLHTADILNRTRVESMIDAIRPDRIVHLAAQAFVPTSMKDPVATYESNIFGGINILEGARKLHADGSVDTKVIVVSTGEVYGRVPAEEQPITEATPLRPNNPYAVSKTSIDLIAQEYALHFGVGAMVARPFNHAGPRQSPTFVCSEFGRQFAMIDAGLQPPVIKAGDLTTERDFTDVRDVVRAYWMMFDRQGTETVFNVCSGSSVPIRQVFDLFREVSGLKVECATVEERLRTYDVAAVRGSSDRLREATGWMPSIALRQTVSDVFDYWRSVISVSA